jgi:hypothetical protein
LPISDCQLIPGDLPIVKLAIGNWKSKIFREWLADPGCFLQTRESNADLETLACSSSEPERNLRGVAGHVFKSFPL